MGCTALVYCFSIFYRHISWFFCSSCTNDTFIFNVLNTSQPCIYFEPLLPPLFLIFLLWQEGPAVGIMGEETLLAGSRWPAKLRLSKLASKNKDSMVGLAGQSNMYMCLWSLCSLWMKGWSTNMTGLDLFPQMLQCCRICSWSQSLIGLFSKCLVPCSLLSFEKYWRLPGSGQQPGVGYSHRKSIPQGWVWSWCMPTLWHTGLEFFGVYGYWIEKQREMMLTHYQNDKGCNIQ